MSDSIKSSKLTVNSQYIKDLSFENPNSPESLSNKDGLPQINVDINVFAKPLTEKLYEVTLSINGKATKKNLPNFLYVQKPCNLESSRSKAGATHLTFSIPQNSTLAP